MIEATIDLDALTRNIRRVVERISPAALMAVVKADAYGHGALPVAQTAVAEGVTWLGVLDAQTGLQLRQEGISRDVRMFAWLFSPEEEYASLIDADIDLGISHLHQLERVATARVSRSARLHLKIDTGLHRNGSTPEHWPALVTRALELQAAGHVEVYGVWTHIGEASEAEDSLAIARFDTAIRVAEALGADIRVRHLAASAAGYARADARFDLVRTGAFLYGIAPGDAVGPAEIGIEPVMTLTSRVTRVTTDGPRMRAVIAGGWLDGIPANAGNLVNVAIAGRRHSLTSVTATETECDTHGHPVQVGDVVTFFGSGVSGEEDLQQWADALGTIGEEIVVRIPRLVPRRYTRS